METANKGKPIRLLKTNVITRKGYFEAVIAGAGLDDSATKLSVWFQVDHGKNAGFTLHTHFILKGKGLARLSYLCASLGITEELSDPSQLVGRRVKLRIVPKLVRVGEKTQLVHRITRFHPIDRASDGHDDSAQSPDITKGTRNGEDKIK